MRRTATDRVRGGTPLPLAGGAGGGRVCRAPTDPPLIPPASGRGTIAGILAALFLAMTGTAALAREAVDASAPSAIAVTLYRDPDRGPQQAMNRNWPRGFAMI